MFGNGLKRQEKLQRPTIQVIWKKSGSGSATFWNLNCGNPNKLTQSMKIKELSGYDQHCSDFPFTKSDEKQGNQLSAVIGDLFIDGVNDSPRVMWMKVCRALRVHGLKMVEKK